MRSERHVAGLFLEPSSSTVLVPFANAVKFTPPEQSRIGVVCPSDQNQWEQALNINTFPPCSRCRFKIGDVFQFLRCPSFLGFLCE